MLTRSFLALLAITFIISALTISLLRGQNTKTQVPVAAPSQVNQNQLDIPIADFNAPPDTNPAERARRLLKNKRHNLRDKDLTPENKLQFVLRENKPSDRTRETQQALTPSAITRRNANHDYYSPVIGGAVTDESPSEPALPTYTCDAVVVGDVTDAKAYLSEDKTAVYSEFTIRVTEVLKNSQSPQLSAGTEVVVLRPGGGVRFPSGTIRKFLAAGRGLPRLGGHYALFLKYDGSAQAFYIITGYEIREGKVLPLDGIPIGGTEAHPFASYQQYIGADEIAFLRDVRSAINHPVPSVLSGFPISQTSPDEGAKR